MGRSGVPDRYSVQAILAAAHGSVVVLAHSTGGLIVPLWADHLRREKPAEHAKLAGVVLNSPWLDMQFPKWQVAALKPLLNFFGTIFPSLPLLQRMLKLGLAEPERVDAAVRKKRRCAAKARASSSAPTA